MTPNTIHLAETTKALVDEAARHAGVSPSEFVEQALRDRLAEQAVKARRERLVSPAKTPDMSPEAWRQFLERVAGSIPDPTFQRHDQGIALMTQLSNEVTNGRSIN